MSRFWQFTVALIFGFMLAGCNRQPGQPAPAPSIPTGTAADHIPAPQNSDIRVNADRRDVDVQIERPGILGDRKVEVNRDTDGNLTREVTRDSADQPLRDRNIDVQVTPGQGVKVDLGKK